MSYSLMLEAYTPTYICSAIGIICVEFYKFDLYIYSVVRLVYTVVMNRAVLMEVVAVWTVILLVVQSCKGNIW